MLAIKGLLKIQYFKTYKKSVNSDHVTVSSYFIFYTRLTRLRAFTLINKRLTLLCIVLLQIPLCLSAPVQKI